MIFLKVPVGMRKIASLTMEKTVRGGTSELNMLLQEYIVNIDKVDLEIMVITTVIQIA